MTRFNGTTIDSTELIRSTSYVGHDLIETLVVVNVDVTVHADDRRLFARMAAMDAVEGTVLGSPYKTNIIASSVERGYDTFDVMVSSIREY